MDRCYLWKFFVKIVEMVWGSRGISLSKGSYCVLVIDGKFLLKFELLIWGNFDIFKLNNVRFKLDYVCLIELVDEKIGKIEYEYIEFEIYYWSLVVVCYVLGKNFLSFYRGFGGNMLFGRLWVWKMGLFLWNLMLFLMRLFRWVLFILIKN